LTELADQFDLHVIFLTRKSAIAHTLRHIASKQIFEKLPSNLKNIINRDLHLQFLKFDNHEMYPQLIDEINKIKIETQLKE
jgi:hypothetical protein